METEGMEKKVKVPKLRFPGFTDEWEQRKLSEIYSSIGNAFVGTATPYYVESGHFYLESNNIKDGQINHNTEIFINDEFYEKQKDKWLHTGDMVMVQSGHVGHAAVITEKLNNSAAHALIMFRNLKEKIEPYFLNYQYQTVKSKKKIENITIGNTIKHILASEMQQFEVDIPKLEEQKKIAEYFTNLDNLITLHQRKLTHLQAKKTSLLQKMFPKRGECFPELRFPGFTDAWEQCKLGEVFERVNERNDGSFDKTKWISVAKMFFQVPEKVQSNNLDTRTYVMREGDIAFEGHPNKEFQFGRFVANDIGAGVVSELFPIYRHIDEYDSYYWKYAIQLEWIMAPIFAKAITSSGNSSNKLDTNHFLRQSIRVPNLAEQKKIGECFSSLDHLITLHQRKLTHLQRQKKALLQQMFV